jgi:Domain of unknown function (DUF4386)
MQTVDKASFSETNITGPDPSWRELYRAGGMSIIIFIVLTFASIVSASITKVPSAGGTATLPDGEATLQYIASNRSGFIIDQILIIGPVTLTIITFLALYQALKHLNKGYSAIGAVSAIVSIIATLPLFSIAFGLVYLSDLYVTATTATQRAALTITAEGLLAQYNTVSISAIFWPLGILIISLVMLKGVFHKSVAYLGIVTGIAGIVSEIIRPIIGAGYGLYGIFLLAWLIAVGWKLYKLA